MIAVVNGQLSGCCDAAVLAWTDWERAYEWLHCGECGTKLACVPYEDWHELDRGEFPVDEVVFYGA